MAILYRRARTEDLEQADALVVRSINDLTERHGFGRMASPSAPNFQSFSLNDDPGGLWVAEEGDQIVGFAFSWICGDLWFLAQLFVSPDHQGHRIGHELLKRTLDHAQGGGAKTRALITFAFNRVSQALYIRHGLLPQIPLYFVSATPDAPADRLPVARLRHVPLQETVSALKDLAQIDFNVLGTSREKHHRYLMSSGAMQGVLFFQGSNPVAYAYFGPDGHIGPLAAARPDALEGAFATALDLAAEKSASRISAFIPGTCPLLSTAINLGMQITFPMLLMSSRSFGDWRQYLPRNPGFM
jgi:GNAT superfamily N-acetyltransferase